ncbi:hypothetical protein MMC25_004223 [Agyrium rufum]|nr:hypothetical protein [Agyrium rufum]
MATKSSILIFYLQLSKEQQVFRWATYTTMAVVNLAGLALTILNIVQCHPVSAVFANPVPQGAVCLDIVTLYLSSSPVNIITDLAILVLPMPILSGLILPRKQKIILIITFSFGAFVAIVDVVRISYLQQAFQVRIAEVGQENATSSRNLEDDDFSWYASLSFMWSAIEVHVGLICACVPSLKPLAHRFLPSILRDMTNPLDVSCAEFSANFYSTTSPNDRHHETEPAPLTSRSRRSSPPAPLNLENDMDFMEFLTTPETAHTHKTPHENTMRSPTAATFGTTASRTPSLTFFDFVNVKNSKPMIKMNNVESLYPLALVTILFFLWGFAYGLLDVLNQQFQLVVHMSTGQNQGLHAAYFVGYLVAPLTFGGWTLRRWGFKASFIVGLCVYATGTLVFWPSAVLTSFPAFLISNFIVGMGLSTLEVAANPFIALCGPPEHSETRLNVSQGIQAIGSVVSPLLAQKVLFKNVQDAPSLLKTQWAYLGIALFVVALALVFFYLPIPEATDAELEELASTRHDINKAHLFGMPIIWVTLAWGVFSQFCYVGGQEAVAEVLLNYINLVRPDSKISAFNYQAIGHTAFAVGRFVCALLGWFVRPRYILFTLYMGLVITSALAMNLEGYAGISTILLILLFESGVFPMIYAICLRGLGKHTKTGASFLTAAVSGGALFPVISEAVSDARGLQYSFSVVVALSAFAAMFPMYLAIVPTAKLQVDPLIHGEEGSGGMGLPMHQARIDAVGRRVRNSWSEAMRRGRGRGKAGGGGDDEDEDDDGDGAGENGYVEDDEKNEIRGSDTMHRRKNSTVPRVEHIESNERDGASVSSSSSSSSKSAAEDISTDGSSTAVRNVDVDAILEDKHDDH